MGTFIAYASAVLMPVLGLIAACYLVRARERREQQRENERLRRVARSMPLEQERWAAPSWWHNRCLN